MCYYSFMTSLKNKFWNRWTIICISLVAMTQTYFHPVLWSNHSVKLITVTYVGFRAEVITKTPGNYNCWKTRSSGPKWCWKFEWYPMGEFTILFSLHPLFSFHKWLSIFTQQFINLTDHSYLEDQQTNQAWPFLRNKYIADCTLYIVQFNKRISWLLKSIR